MERLFGMSFGRIYPLYAAKVERKGRSVAELDEVLRWLTGFDDQTLHQHIEGETSLRDFFAAADLNVNASLITGVVCGVRVEDIDDPLMQRIRYMDKLVDELARGKKLASILRSCAP